MQLPEFKKKSNMKTFYYLCTLAYLLTITPSYSQHTPLFHFETAVDGGHPYGSLISDGLFLYGMTNQGGANDKGTIFKVMPDGSDYEILLDFEGTINGTAPQGSLISDGTFLYGMTQFGGINHYGTIFKIMPDGSGFEKLLDFDGLSNGAFPFGSLIYDGNFLYGMTQNGGVNQLGTIFKIMPDGSGYEKLLDFEGTTNGSSPRGSLVSDGNFLYGMTTEGGTNDLGTIFKIMTDGTGYEKLLDFEGATNGSYPQGSLLIEGTFLYGMTGLGGVNNIGTIFKIKSDGSGYEKLLDMDGYTSGYGAKPFGSLVSDGTFLYGMDSNGGTSLLGTIFKIMPDGSGYEKLVDFNGSNGNSPQGSLIFDGSFLYGMAWGGGNNNGGVLFKYEPTLGLSELTSGHEPIVYPNPTSGKITIDFNTMQESIEIRVLSLTGQLVATESVINTNQVELTINNEPGIYFVELSNDRGKRSVVKVIKN
jgi:uncharacterized repeat protein (TIGR03803 family)